MPLTHVRTFRVRYYECDPRGDLHHANYLRYMQEAAFGATAAAGYDLSRYQAMNRIWLARETEIEYHRPLRYGDLVQVKTWVADFRRVRSRRAYEFRLVGPDALVARASTDWVFLDSTTGRPSAIPPELMTAFFPEGLPLVDGCQQARRRLRFPPLPSLPPDEFRPLWVQHRRAEWQDLDQVQHVNNAVYLAYIMARRHQIEYLGPAVLNDDLELTTWLSDVKDTTAHRHYAVTRASDGSPVVRARTFCVWVDLETGEPVPIPEAFLADLALNTVNAQASEALTEGVLHERDQNPVSQRL
jgi:YbgC/YbaW family acyl-CoA thioester hydrolase